MKILSIMCDMVRPNILDFSKPVNNGFEEKIMEIGGTLFSNCFSPGPDTGRSMGCYWSGKIPQDNGCDTRAKYPKFYLKTDSFLDVLAKKNFNFYFFTNPNEKVLGDLPAGYDNKGIHNEDLDLKKFLRKIDLSQENIYAHIFLTDFHWAIDDYGANGQGVEQGLRILRESIDIIFDILPIDKFDYVIIFSDHGFKYNIEFESQQKYLMLNRDRSNVFMFVHQREGKSDFLYNEKLCSLIDIYPTIMEMINEKYEGYAYSLFSDNEHEFVIADDHREFLPKVNQTIELWAFIKKNKIYFRTFDGYYQDDGNEFELNKDEFDDFLCSQSRSFSEVLKQLNILKLYKTMATDKSYYTNGEPRYSVKKSEFIKRFNRKKNLNTTRETYNRK